MLILNCGTGGGVQLEMMVVGGGEVTMTFRASEQVVVTPTTPFARLIPTGIRLLIQATADSGSLFVRWEGDCIPRPGAPPETIGPFDIYNNLTCTAVFEPVSDDRFLTIHTSTRGNVEVLDSSGATTVGACPETASVPDGNGNYQCVFPLDTDTTVLLLRGIPGDVDVIFDHWAGDCSGTNPDFALSITSSQPSCTAVFADRMMTTCTPLPEIQAVLDVRDHAGNSFPSSGGTFQVPVYTAGNPTLYTITAVDSIGTDVFSYAWGGDCAGEFTTPTPSLPVSATIGVIYTCSVTLQITDGCDQTSSTEAAVSFVPGTP